MKKNLFVGKVRQSDAPRKGASWRDTLGLVRPPGRAHKKQTNKKFSRAGYLFVYEARGGEGEAAFFYHLPTPYNGKALERQNGRPSERPLGRPTEDRMVKVADAIASEAAPRRKRRQIVRIAEVQPEDVRWWWPPYLPHGMVTLVTGDPGEGKGWLTCSIAAHVTHGRPFPGADSALPHGRMTIFALEDAPAVLRYRLELQEAHLGRVNLCFEQVNLTQPSGLAAAREVINETDPRIVVFDPITSFMGDADPNKQTVVNGMLGALAALAKETDTTIIVVRHRRKPADGERKGRDPQFSGAGSIGFLGAARSELLVGQTPDGQRIMAQVKNSLGPIGPSMEFTLDADTGKLSWIGPSDIEAWEIVGKMSQRSRGRPFGGGKSSAAVAFLTEHLHNGAVPAHDCIVAAGAKGINKNTLLSAKREALVRTFRKDERWWWEIADGPVVGGETKGASDDGR